MHHHTIQINQLTRCSNFSNLLLDVYVQLNMFRASSRPSSGAQQLQQQQPLFLLLEHGGSSAVGRGWADWPDRDQQHCYHHCSPIFTCILQMIFSFPISDQNFVYISLVSHVCCMFHLSHPSLDHSDNVQLITFAVIFIPLLVSPSSTKHV